MQRTYKGGRPIKPVKEDAGTNALSPTDFHVLLVLAGGDLYGYAILKAVAAESNGAVQPEIGSLYRVLGRLMSMGLVKEVEGADSAERHRGRPRRYYRLTAEGREAMRAETARLEQALGLARARELSPKPSQS